MEEHGRGQAVVSSRQNHDIEDQETGVELALKQPQIVSIANYARAPRRQGELYSTASNLPRGTTFLSTLSPGGSISMGRQYQLTKFKPSRRG